jgi:hypothetical protein
MKKLRILLPLLLLSFIVPAKADNAPTDQLIVTLLQHVVGISEFTTEGKTKLEFIDGIVQVGHYKKDYILALDAGFCNNTVPGVNGRLAMTSGIHAHVLSAINSWGNINPALAETFNMLELTPRVSYDGDVHKFVYGATFGARIPF